MPSSVQNVPSLFAGGAACAASAPGSSAPSAQLLPPTTPDREAAEGGGFRRALDRVKPREEDNSAEPAERSAHSASNRTDRPNHPNKPRRADQKKGGERKVRQRGAAPAETADAAGPTDGVDALTDPAPQASPPADAPEGASEAPHREAREGKGEKAAANAAPARGVPADPRAPAPAAPPRRPASPARAREPEEEGHAPDGQKTPAVALTARPAVPAAATSQPGADPASAAADADTAGTGPATDHDEDPDPIGAASAGNNAGLQGAQLTGLSMGQPISAAGRSADGANANVPGDDAQVGATAGSAGADATGDRVSPMRLAGADWDDLFEPVEGGDDTPPSAKQEAQAPADRPQQTPFATALDAAGAKAGPSNAAAAGKGDATAPSSPAPEERFAQVNHARIVTGVRGELIPNGGTMHLRLDPPELGDLQVSVRLRDGVMTAAFHTSNDEATRLLSHSLGELKSMLEAQGVSVERLQVQQSPKNPNPGEPRDSRDHRQGGRHDPLPEQRQSDQREQQRKQIVQRMWDKLAGNDPVDMVA